VPCSRACTYSRATRRTGVGARGCGAIYLSIYLSIYIYIYIYVCIKCSAVLYSSTAAAVLCCAPVPAHRTRASQPLRRRPSLFDGVPASSTASQPLRRRPSLFDGVPASSTASQPLRARTWSAHACTLARASEAPCVCTRACMRRDGGAGGVISDVGSGAYIQRRPARAASQGPPML
jgi:hypothetical protein